MEVEILKEALDLAREKTDLAVAIAGSGRFPVKTVAATLEVARSNIIERQQAVRLKRGPQSRAGDRELIADIRRLSTSDRATATGGSPRSSSASGDPPGRRRSTPSGSIG
jgi:hypothetical protein